MFIFIEISNVGTTFGLRANFTRFKKRICLLMSEKFAPILELIDENDKRQGAAIEQMYGLFNQTNQLQNSLIAQPNSFNEIDFQEIALNFISQVNSITQKMNQLTEDLMEMQSNVKKSQEMLSQIEKSEKESALIDQLAQEFYNDA